MNSSCVRLTIAAVCGLFPVNVSIAQDKVSVNSVSVTAAPQFGTAYRNPYGKFPSPSTRGDRIFSNYFFSETNAISGRMLQSIESREQWEARKPLFREQLFEMLSLDPLPEKTELSATITGTMDHPEFTVENLHYQSRPGLYATANLYIPKGLKKPAPAILYVCGHGGVVVDGVPFGNKVTYQHHGAWFARNGYVCMILDTVQLGEISGLHHGTHNLGMWWWNSRGYSSAGAEAWNCIRALDYLQSRPEVDGARIGVTGRSGGGAYSWWIAALDERIKAACPVAGITDLQNHVVDGCVEGHCDCMFMVNTYRWDYAQVAALMAPRPLLICNTDKDTIFPLDGIVRIHSEVRKVYDLYSAPEKLGLLITEGPHKDTQDLQVPVMRWFNKWLKQDESPVPNFAEKLFKPQQLKVFDKLPPDELTSRCHENFTQLASESSAFDASKAVALLRKKTFGAWPKSESIGTVNLREISSAESDGVKLSVFEFDSQPNMPVRFYLARPVDIQPESLQLEVVDETNWKSQLELGRVGFASALKDELTSAGIDVTKASDPATIDRFKMSMQELRNRKSASITVTPRGIGLTALGKNPKYQTQIRRRFMLLGSTLASSQTWDMLQASAAARSLPGMSSLSLHYHASPEMTEVASFAALFEEKLSSLSLAHAPRVDKEAPDFLNWSRIVTPHQLLSMVKAKTTVLVKD